MNKEVITECTALKRKEILMHATTWMNTDDIMLTENKPFTKDKHCTVPLRIVK